MNINNERNPLTQHVSPPFCGHMLAKNALNKTEIACEFLKNMDDTEEKILESERVSLLPPYEIHEGAILGGCVCYSCVAGPIAAISCVFSTLVSSALGCGPVLGSYFIINTCISASGVGYGTAVAAFNHAINNRSIELTSTSIALNQISRLKIKVTQIKEKINNTNNSIEKKQLETVCEKFSSFINSTRF